MKYKIVQIIREASQDLAETKMVRSFQANMKKAIEDMTTVLKAQAIREASQDLAETKMVRSFQANMTTVLKAQAIRAVNQVSKVAQIILSLHTLKLHLIDILQGNLQMHHINLLVLLFLRILSILITHLQIIVLTLINLPTNMTPMKIHH